jgi:hypothetical protein
MSRVTKGGRGQDISQNVLFLHLYFRALREIEWLQAKTCLKFPRRWPESTNHPQFRPPPTINANINANINS